MINLAVGVFILAVWLAWGLQFAIMLPGNRGVAVKKDSRARRGMILEGLAFCTVYIHRPEFWASTASAGRLAAGLVCAVVAFGFSGNAIGHLGRQWRVDAGLNDDHELVKIGAYRYVRHPIYASMFWLLLMSIGLVGSLPGWPIGMVLFIAGTEIRIRVEDGLLRERFGEEFIQWQQRVPAWLPFVR